MRRPELEANRFTKLVLERIVDHASETMVELGFQLIEGFPAGVTGFAFYVDGGESQTLKPGERGVIQFGADGEHDQARAVGDGFGQDHPWREFFDHDAFHVTGLCWNERCQGPDTVVPYRSIPAESKMSGGTRRLRADRRHTTLCRRLDRMGDIPQNHAGHQGLSFDERNDR